MESTTRTAIIAVRQKRLAKRVDANGMGRNRDARLKIVSGVER